MNQVRTVYRDCNFCGSSGPDILFQKDGFTIVQCAGCRLIYVGDPPLAEALPDYYREDYFTGGNEKVFQDYIGEKEKRVRGFLRSVVKIRKLCPKGRLLDVGCAAGFFLEAAKAHFEAHGVELSEFSSRYARETLGHKVITGDLFSARFPGEWFDVITMWDVIEHLADPLAALKEATRILKPGGILVISTGDVSSLNAQLRKAAWGLLAPPWHLFYFSRKLLHSKLTDLGYVIRGHETNGNLLGSSNKIISNIFTKGAAKVLKLGDIVTLYAEKGKSSP